MSEQAWELPTARQDEDIVLVRAIADGSTEAFNHFYLRYGHQILFYLETMLGDWQQAEEVLQDVMLAIWRGAAQFRGESRVRTWLLAIARRCALKARQRRQPQNEELEADAVPYFEAFELIERQIDNRVVYQALQQLPANQREIIQLVFYHQLSGPEIAALLDIAPGTVKSRLHRAKEMLYKVLQGELEHDREP